MAKTRGHSSHYGPIPPYSGYPGYVYPSSGSHGHQPSSYLGQQQLGYHRPQTEETSPPPVYEYLSTSRPGKDNYKYRLDFLSLLCESHFVVSKNGFKSCCLLLLESYQCFLRYFGRYDIKFAQFAQLANLESTFFMR